MNPNYPIQVEGWRGTVRQQALQQLSPEGAVESLIESAHVSPYLSIPEPRKPAQYYPRGLKPAA